MKTLNQISILTAFTCLVLTHAGAQLVPLQQASADQTYAPYYSPSETLDGITNGDHGWGLSNGGTPATIVFATQTNIGFASGSVLTFKLYQGTSSPSYPLWHLGRFRLSVTADDRTTFADGLANGGDISANWFVLEPASFSAANGATLTKLSDNSLLASGGNADLDTSYTITALTLLTNITGIRLEALQDGSLPNNGPGRPSPSGDFVLQEFQVSVAPAQSCVPPAGLVAWWRGEGDAIDQVGTNNGTLQNGVTFAAGEVGQAFSFNGSSQFVQVPASGSWDFTSHDGTMAFWTYVRVMPSSVVAGFMNQINNDQNWAIYVYSDGRLAMGRAGVNEIATGSGVISSGVWYLVTVTRTGNTTKLFVNSTQVASATTAVWTSSSNPLKIGGHTYGADYYLNGLMDEIMLFDRALSASEIAAIYTSGSAGICTNPPAISVQPANQTTTSGANVTFSVGASGSYPLTYQWLFNETNLTNGGRITGAQSNALNITGVLQADVGNYQVIITNAYGAVTSAIASLTIVTNVGIFWTNTTGGNWSTAANWSTGTVPGSNDNAFIISSGTYTVTLDVNATVASLLVGGSTGQKTFSVAGRSLTINGSTSFNSNTFLNLNGGILTGLGVLTNNGTLTLINSTINVPMVNAGTMTCHGGNINGAFSAQSNSVLTAMSDFSGSVVFASGFVNHGIIQIVSIPGWGATLNVTSGVLVNAPEGQIQVTAHVGNPASFSAQLDNQGVMTISNVVFMDRASSAIANSGTITIATNGCLTINQSGNGSSFSNTGALYINSSAVNYGSFNLTQPADGVFNNSGTISMTGDFVFSISGGVFNYSGGLVTGGRVALAGTTANIAPGFSGGTTALQLTGSSVVNGSGTITNAAGQTLTLINSTINVPVVNAGTMTCHGGNINGGFSAQSNSVLTAMSDFSGAVVFASGFVNHGIIRIVSIPGWEATLNVTSGVLVNAPEGQIQVTAHVGNPASFNAQLDNQGVMNISNVVFMARASSAIANSGTITIATNGCLIINQSGSGSSFSNTGAMYINSSAVNYGSFNLTQPADGVFNNSGTILMTGDFVFSITGGAFNYTGGSVSGGTVVLAGTTANIAPGFPQSTTALQLTGSSVVNGSGTITNAAGQTLTLINSTINVPVVNAGTMTCHGGNINGGFSAQSNSVLTAMSDFSGAVVFASGFVNHGIIRIVSIPGWGATLNVTSGVLVNAPEGQIQVTAHVGNPASFNAQLDNQGVMNISNVVFMARASSTIANSGTITIATNGCLTVNQSGNSSSFSNTGAMYISSSAVNYGSFNLTQPADGVFNNSGTIIMAGGSTLSLSGGALFLSTTSIIGFSIANSQAERLFLNSAVQLNGSLNISLTNGFVPTVGDAFPIITWASRKGGFSQANGFNVGNGLYFQGIADSSGLSLVTKTTNVPMPPPPTNLVNQVVAFGDTAVFSFSPLGVEPFSYQWTFNGTNLLGQTNVSLIITNVQGLNLGTYCAIVTDALGVTNTYCAHLSAITPPGITGQPSGQTAAAGANITLTATGNGGGPLRYQWRINGENIPGATNSTYTITNAQPRDGGTYSVLVANPVRVISSSNAKVLVLSPAVPFADNFAARGTTNSFSGVGSGTNTNATHEVGETNHVGKSSTHSVWLQWTAPANGVATFNTRGSSFDTLLAIYTSSNIPPAVTNIIGTAADDDRGGYFTSQAVFNAAAGTNYFIAVDGLSSASGDIVLSWNLDTNITQIPRIFQQPLDLTVSLGSNATFNVFAVSTTNLSYQWYLGDWLAIPEATSTNLTLTNVSYLDVGTYSVEVTSAAGQVVESLSASLELGPSSDAHSFDKLEDLLANFSGGGRGGGSFAPLSKRGHGVTPQSLSFPSVSSGTIGSQIINNFNSTTEQGEPIHSDVIGGSSRWYLLTADTNGTLVIDTMGSDIATVMSVYVGSDILSLSTVASDRNSATDGVRSLVRFSAKPNTNYLIAVDGVNGAQGNINLNWRLGTPPNTSGPVQNLVINRGGDLLLNAGISNDVTSPFFQWRRNGANIAGATNSTYSLANVRYDQVGSYSVLVSNLVGQVINSIATVSAQSPLGLAREAATSVRLTGSATQASVLQLSTNLSLWSPIYTNSSPLLPVSYLDTNLPARAKSFYRLQPWP